MKTATLLAFLLLGLACTYAVTVEDSDDDFAEDEHAAENELIENDEEKAENEVINDEEKRAIVYRPRLCIRKCRRTIEVRKPYKLTYSKSIRYFCSQRCRCNRSCLYGRCYGYGYICGRKVCSIYAYPPCPYY